jgi:hypothetical protein
MSRLIVTPGNTLLPGALHYMQDKERLTQQVGSRLPFFFYTSFNPKKIRDTQYPYDFFSMQFCEKYTDFMLM